MDVRARAQKEPEKPEPVVTEKLKKALEPVQGAVKKLMDDTLGSVENLKEAMKEVEPVKDEEKVEKPKAAKSYKPASKTKKSYKKD